jgi:hypothetical protein
MRVNYIEAKKLPKPSAEFRKYFDSYLKLCDFKEEEKLGILFYLGAILPGRLNSIEPDSLDYKQYLSVLSLYSKSTGDFSDYGDLNDAVFNDWIYNANLAISKIADDKSSIDENLRTLPYGTIIVGKSKPKHDFLDLFEQDSFSLNVIQNLNDEIFTKTGLHLYDRDYSYAKAYEAGFAYRMMMAQMDIKGTDYLLSRIDSFLSPLFQALFYSPFLYLTNEKAFKSNHLFSQILNNFYGGQNSDLFPVIDSIHQYHQFIFYKENSSELKDFWGFNQDTSEGSAIIVFHNALNIHKTKLRDKSKIIQQSGVLYDENFIDAKISTSDFLHSILNVIQSKYSINGVDEFIEGIGAKWDTGWNNKGDYIQFLVVLFYETCLHALVVDQID